MIIDTTCSVVERKMQEEPETVQLTFNFVRNHNFIDGGGLGTFPMTFNDSVTFMPIMLPKSWTLCEMDKEHLLSEVVSLSCVCTGSETSQEKT